MRRDIQCVRKVAVHSGYGRVQLKCDGTLWRTIEEVRNVAVHSGYGRVQLKCDGTLTHGRGSSESRCALRLRQSPVEMWWLTVTHDRGSSESRCALRLRQSPVEMWWHTDAREGKFGKSLCTYKRCWNRHPRASIKAWTSPPLRHRVPSHFNWTLP